MTLGALVDAGAEPDYVAGVLTGLALPGWALHFEPVLRCGLAATHANVVVSHDHGDDHDHDGQSHEHRPYRAIRELLDAADIPTRVRRRAHAVFAALAEVEAAMHRMTVDDVEFHEVGSVDAIIDIVGTCAALESLGIDRIVCSPITTGHGSVRSAHGTLPNPAPAVAALLARYRVPTVGVDETIELATPTGVALMCALADRFGAMPSLTVEAVGYGAGNRDTPGRPNAVQVVVGLDASGAPGSAAAPDAGQPLRVLECNVDDITGEELADALAALMAAGANDAWITPVLMKKGRPAHTVHALCDPAAMQAVVSAMVRHTGTLGVRATDVTRWPQPRDEAVVTVDGQPIAVKLGHHRVKVEHDDAAAAAEALGLPLREVMRRAEHEARRR
jgi:uncharacterized protein (TIGR00299 family) protein